MNFPKDHPTTWTEGDGLMPPPPPGYMYPPSPDMHVGILQPPLERRHGPIGRPPGARSRIQTAGLANLTIILLGFVISAAVAAFIIFLWSCSLAINTDSNASSAPDDRDHGLGRGACGAGVQFAAAVSMAAAVLLEEKGVPTRLAPLALTLRATSMPQTWRLVQYLDGTLALDVPATLAVAVPHPYKQYQESTDDAFYWAAGSPDYPLFAEYTGTSSDSDAPSDSDPVRMLDTGLSLRALPPFRDSNTRAALDGYEGYATVFDARVSCMTPRVISKLAVGDQLGVNDWTTAQIHGMLRVDLPARARWAAGDADQGVRQMVDAFNCTVARHRAGVAHPGLGQPGTSAADFMVFNATGKGLEWKQALGTAGGSLSWTVTNDTAPWTHFALGPLHPNIALDISFCLETFQSSASIPTRMTRPGRPRPEPALVWDQDQREYDASGITRLHAGVAAGLSNADRNIMTLAERTNWTEGESWVRPFTQYATSVERFQNLWDLTEPASNISAMLCTFARSALLQTFRAHRHHVAVFQAILRTTSSLPLAIQAVWTILIQHIHYDFLIEFTVAEPAKYSLYADCEVPVRKRGLVFALVFLAVHDVAVLVLARRFLSRPRMAMPGQLWQGFGQLAASLSASASLRQGGAPAGQGYMPYMYHGDEARDDGDGTSVAEWAVRATTARDLEVRREMRRESGGRRDDVVVRLVQEVDDQGSGRLCLRRRAR
ncbi:hypothetical protein B0T22DRAFT_539953 [Podospora appendiculata]|uniref:Uncharacterized protein n=1 Tax=Podospora appendiculata TaxID=314037 RepID=A0AAE0WZH9_9PEZI|nr:hypothetical protein B0T22DRAFT_539953 [Podospora appendiculata]